MKMSEAMRIIGGLGETPPGYRVHFERVEGIMLASDYFPDRPELPFRDEEYAWLMARLFADKTTGRCVNVYVVRADNWTPVPHYQERMIVNRDEAPRAKRWPAFPWWRQRGASK